ncbi:MAG: heavy metal-binding domain-containing protein [Methanobacterium sp.]|nr:heavy metal-binding domain-containing protein [Methanobacterium sp.]
MSSIKNNYFFEKRWALAAITIGFLVGFFSAYLCIIWHLVIFGFNIMYIVSPLLAGLVETIIARRKYGKSTGAISALLTFILINIYGWFLPGTFVDPTKEPASLSLITLIAIGLTIQAAFPILVNYILFVVIVGIFVRLISLPSRIAGRAKKKEDRELVRGEEIIFEGLTEPLVSTPDLEGENISDYVGMVTGEAIAEEKESQGVLNKILKMVQPLELEDLNLIDAREQAVARMLKNAESLGATTVVEILIDYVSVGGLQGSATIVTATGTAVILK